MYQGGRLKNMVFPFTRHLSSGQPPQLVVHERQSIPASPSHRRPSSSRAT